VGIDGDKTVITMRETALDAILRLLSSQKIEWVIIEGYKARSFPRIVIGDLIADNCVLSNPTIQEVLESLDHFQKFDA
jgi:molybdopterin-guanine dinucleotide biosynthesis protein